MPLKKPLGLYAGDVEGFSTGDFIDVVSGGTGSITKTGGFNNLSPLTTKGDIVVTDGSNNIRLAVGLDATVLTADATQSSGVKWATPAAAVVIPSIGGRSFLMMGA